MKSALSQRAGAALARHVTLDRIALMLVVVALVPIASPFLHPGYPDGHDTRAHLTYIYRFDRALWQGQFPVRWVEGTRPGDNQPLFNFYQVGFYYLVALVHLVVPRLSDALKATTVLVWWMGSAFVFALFRRSGTAAAAVACVMFALSPYLIVDGLIRNAFPELAAIAFAMGVLWSADRWLTSGRTCYMAALALLLAMTLLCHLPATLIMVPVWIAHVCWLAGTRQTTTRRVLELAPAVALGAGMAAFYVIPALWEADLIQLQRMTQGSMDFHQNFVPPEQWTRFALTYRWSFGSSVHDVSDLIPVHISLVHLVFIAAAAAMAAVRVARRSVDVTAAGLIQWLAITAFAVFMMTSSSAVVWNAVPALSYIQFPWRFFMLLSISGAALGALLVRLVTDRRLQAVLLIATIGLQVHLYQRRLKPRSYLPVADMNIDDPGWRDTPDAMIPGFYEPAYDPVGVTREAAFDIGRWTIVQGSGTIDPQRVTDAALRLAASSPAGMTVRINSHAFPGWLAQVDGREARMVPTPGEHYMEIAVPPGRHSLVVAFTNTPVRAAANAISLASAIVMAILSGSLAVGRIRRGRAARPQQAGSPAAM